MLVKVRLNNKVQIFFRKLLLQFPRISKFKVIKIFGYHFIIDLKTKGISQAVYAQRYREIDHTILYSKLLIGKNRILDLGANIGYYLLLTARFSDKSSEIICIEPDQRNLQLLRSNIALNDLQDRCTVIEGVVGGEVNRTFVNITSASNLNKIDDRGDVEVDGYSLDYLHERFGSFDSLRMDIEGAEAIVLSNNANKFLSAMPMDSVIFMEVHPGHYIPDSGTMLASLKNLQKNGFTKFGCVSSGKKPAPELISKFSFPKEKFKEGKFIRYNFDAVPLDDLCELALKKPKVIRYIYCRKA